MEGNARESAGRDNSSDNGELLTSAEVASLFGVDRRTVVLWAKRGRIPALRTPGGQHRFRAEEIRRLLDMGAHTRGGARGGLGGGLAPPPTPPSCYLPTLANTSRLVRISRSSPSTVISVPPYFE
jgi:excisionase family DNA binding protein